jgi:RHS repeat-associated protein
VTITGSSACTVGRAASVAFGGRCGTAARKWAKFQVPNAGLENDAYVGQGTVGGNSMNLSPYYGAVAYVFDGQLDRPLAVTRLRYSNYTPANTIVEIPTFTYYPMWDIHGLADLGMFLPNSPTECPGTTKPGDKVTCVSYVAQLLWSPYRDVWHQQKAWHGSLLEDKAGTGGLMYRRNRYYDSKSGRFTQEDPIGLAGGLNLYGYAGGDPVNYSDPFGLMADDDCKGFVGCIAQFFRNQWRGFTTPLDQGPPSGGSAGWFAGRLLLAAGTSGTPGQLGPVSAAGQATAAGISSVDDIFANPQAIRGLSPADLGDVISRAEQAGWRVGTLTRGSRAGEGLTLRELNAQGNLTGRYIQWHPGGGHHGGGPYWKISSPVGGRVWVFPQGAL